MDTSKSNKIWRDYWILGYMTLANSMREEEVTNNNATMDSLIDPYNKW